MLTIWVSNFWRKDFGTKAAHKMLVKLTPGEAGIDKYTFSHDHNTSIFLSLTNRPNEKCYITLGSKELPATNALAYWANL